MTKEQQQAIIRLKNSGLSYSQISSQEKMSVTMETKKAHNGKPCRVEKMQVGETLFTVISVQGDNARETADEKVKKLILNSTQLSRAN